MTLVLLGVLLAQDAMYSGPQKGENTPPFKVLDLAGKELDCVSQWKGAPTLTVFVHELTRPAAALLRKLDEHAARRPDLKALIVLLGDDVNKNERYAPVLQGIMKFKSTLGVSVDGKEGPGAYGLNRQVQLTILLSKDNVVAGNWSIVSPNETDAPAIVKAIDAMLGVKEDLEARIAALEKEVRELRAMIERLQPQRPGARGPERALPGAAPKDGRLNGLMRGLIRPERANEDVDAALKEILEYVHGKDDLRQQAKDGFVLLRELKYGTEHAQKRIRETLESWDK